MTSSMGPLSKIKKQHGVLVLVISSFVALFGFERCKLYLHRYGLLVISHCLLAKLPVLLVNSPVLRVNMDPPENRVPPNLTVDFISFFLSKCENWANPHNIYLFIYIRLLNMI